MADDAPSPGEAGEQTRRTPRSLKQLRTTLKDNIYEADSPAKQREKEEDYKDRATAAASTRSWIKAWAKRPTLSRSAQHKPVFWYEPNFGYHHSVYPPPGSSAEKAVAIFDKIAAEDAAANRATERWKDLATRQARRLGHIDNEWKRDLVLRNVMRSISRKLTDRHVLVLQGSPPEAAQGSENYCAHPYCPATQRLGMFRLSLEPRQNLELRRVPTRASSGRSQRGLGEKGVTWYCLDCVEGLFNGVGLMTSGDILNSNICHHFPEVSPAVEHELPLRPSSRFPPVRPPGHEKIGSSASSTSRHAPNQDPGGPSRNFGLDGSVDCDVAEGPQSHWTPSQAKHRHHDNIERLNSEDKIDTELGHTSGVISPILDLRPREQRLMEFSHVKESLPRCSSNEDVVTTSALAQSKKSHRDQLDGFTPLSPVAEEFLANLMERLKLSPDQRKGLREAVCGFCPRIQSIDEAPQCEQTRRPAWRAINEAHPWLDPQATKSAQSRTMCSAPDTGTLSSTEEIIKVVAATAKMFNEKGIASPRSWPWRRFAILLHREGYYSTSGARKSSAAQLALSALKDNIDPHSSENFTQLSNETACAAGNPTQGDQVSLAQSNDSSARLHPTVNSSRAGEKGHRSQDPKRTYLDDTQQHSTDSTPSQVSCKLTLRAQVMRDSVLSPPTSRTSLQRMDPARAQPDILVFQQSRECVPPSSTEGFKSTSITKASSGIDSVEPISDSICVCRKPAEHLIRVICQRDTCPIGLYHLKCVKLSRPPLMPEQWLCPRCSSKRSDPLIDLTIPGLDGPSDQRPKIRLKISAPSSPQKAVNSSTPTPASPSLPIRTRPRLRLKVNTSSSSPPPGSSSANRRSTSSPRSNARSPSDPQSATSQDIKLSLPPKIPGFASLASFIVPEVRHHRLPYYTLTNPQRACLGKWKDVNVLSNLQRSDNTAFMERNNFFVPMGPDAELPEQWKSEEVMGVMEIGGLIVELSTAECKGKMLSEALAMVEERVQQELHRLGWVAEVPQSDESGREESGVRRINLNVTKDKGKGRARGVTRKRVHWEDGSEGGDERTS